MLQSARIVWKEYANFRGRARRSEFWYFQLFISIIYFGAVFLSDLLLLFGGAAAAPGRSPSVGDSALFALAVTIWSLLGLGAIVLFIPSLAVSVRRLHDAGQSGWWLLIGLIPGGGIVLLIFYVLDSQPGTNRWGPNPKGVDLAYGQQPQHAAPLQYAAPQAIAQTCNICGAARDGGAFCGTCGAS
jgi:uncharacterized membrane protein YhaH (DUF805 family)